MKCSYALVALLISGTAAFQQVTKPVSTLRLSADQFTGEGGINFALVGCPLPHPLNKLLQTGSRSVPGQVQFSAQEQAKQRSLHWSLHWGCVNACGPTPVSSMCVTECEVDMYQCIDGAGPGETQKDIDECQNKLLDRVAKENGVFKKDGTKAKTRPPLPFHKDLVRDDRPGGPVEDFDASAKAAEKKEVEKAMETRASAVEKKVTDALDKFGKEMKLPPIKTPDSEDSVHPFGKEEEAKKETPGGTITKKETEKDEFGKLDKAIDKRREGGESIVDGEKWEVPNPFGKERDGPWPFGEGKSVDGPIPSKVDDDVTRPRTEVEKEVDIEKSLGPLPPLSEFMPSCLAHLEQLIAMIDHSYTDIHLQTVLENECMLEKDFPSSCDSGFERHKHCTDFAAQLHEARMLELETGSKKGYEQACQDYYNLRMGIEKVAKMQEEEEDEFVVQTKVSSNWFDSLSMPKVSVTMHCIMTLTFQYFGIHTLLIITKTLVGFKFNLIGLQTILETACSTVMYAPMLCVLFLAARMRAIQLSQGETEKYQLPQPWVQTSMIATSTAILLQVVLVILVGILCGSANLKTDEEGNLDVSRLPESHATGVKVLTVVRYLVMAMLYGGFTAVVVGIITMKAPAEIWGDKEVPVSPAVMCTILLSGLFFLIYLVVAITKTIFELSRGLRDSPFLLKLEASATSAKMTVNFAPMLCILFIGARMRALQIDPKNGNPQSWAQTCFYLCTLSVVLQALLVLLLPFVAKGDCKRGVVEGDVSFSMANPKVGAALTVMRYICLIALYGGVVTVMYSIFVIQHPEGPSKTPPVSPAMQCVMNLTVQYFFVYTAIFICATIKSFFMGRAPSGDAEQAYHGVESPVAKAMTRALAIFDSARSTVMFAPMLAILFIGARMRALQLSRQKDGTIPVNAGPQKWVQDAMFLATWAVFIQLIMTMLVPLFTGSAPEYDQNGNAKIPSGRFRVLAIIAEVIRYTSMLLMYVGAIVVVVGVFAMTPESIQPNDKTTLVPGAEVPNPPQPPASKL